MERRLGADRSQPQPDIEVLKTIFENYERFGAFSPSRLRGFRDQNGKEPFRVEIGDFEKPVVGLAFVGSGGSNRGLASGRQPVIHLGRGCAPDALMRTVVSKVEESDQKMFLQSKCCQRWP